jgi:hypothetical protein
VLTNALEDPTILGGKVIDLLNTVCKYSYVALLLTCFILALGNRPQGSNVGYTLAFVGYAIFVMYMTVRLSRQKYNQVGLTVSSSTVCRDFPGSQGRAASGC